MLKPDDTNVPSPASATPSAPASALNSSDTPAAQPAKSLSHSAQVLRHEVRVWTRDLLIAIGLALVIIVFLYQPVKLEGTSMARLLSDQERIFINKFVYRFEPIERGDVVVFWYPLDRSKSFIKRVIALPGDSVEIRSGHLYVDDKELLEPYVPSFYLDGTSYAERKIPVDSYFVMGDHRDSSNDSRI